jgi:hypothetical protein
VYVSSFVLKSAMILSIVEYSHDIGITTGTEGGGLESPSLAVFVVGTLHGAQSASSSLPFITAISYFKKWETGSV